MSECQFQKVDELDGYVVVRCLVCAATFPVPADHLAGLRGECPGPRRPAHAGGAGTELKALLEVAGITGSSSCKCTARAAEMDARGLEWVEANRETVLAWLREEATRRGLPWIPAAASFLVRKAIRNARRKGFR